MVQKGDNVWVVRNNTSVNVYKSGSDARKSYIKQLNYYKTHKPDENDKHSYVVWSEVDDKFECGMHYTLVDDYWNDGETRKIMQISYFKTKVY